MMMKNKKRIKFDLKCNRCGLVSFYVKKPDNTIENRTHCKYCKNVPDNLLDIFIENRKYSRICKICNEIVFYSHKASFLQSFGVGQVEHKTIRCKKCVNKIRGSIRTKNFINEWKPITGTVNISVKHLRKIKRFWNALPENKKENVLRKTDAQKRHFWSHLSRMRKVLRIKSQRKAFEKYRGDNHWMKNPNVLRKIKNSCKKYRGDNHWFRNKNYIKKSH